MRFNWQRYWYDSHSFLMSLLLPVSLLFRSIVSIRRFLYRKKILKTHRFSVPIIVVGNITVGGTGKTPFVIWLAKELKKLGMNPGIVSRGVGGQQQKSPRSVTLQSDPAEVGDEAVLMARRTNLPVVVGIDRVAAVKALLATSSCNLVISDDGLQHYRLGRNVEIAIVDGIRGLGNKHFLPAGPLRESPERLKEVDFVISQGGVGEFVMKLKGRELISLQDEKQTLSLESLAGKKVHAIAAIGNPQRFFDDLRQYNISVVEHIFPDHYLYRPEDLHFADDDLIIMTEKDAVKCQSFATKKHWFLPVDVNISNHCLEAIKKRIQYVEAIS